MKKYCERCGIRTVYLQSYPSCGRPQRSKGTDEGIAAILRKTGAEAN